MQNKNLTYRQRAELSHHPVSKRLFQLMEQKKSNLSVALDVTNKDEFLRIADLVGPYICILKTHIDIIEDFDQDLITQLKHLSDKHNFLIFEDRKFADIGNTVKNQYSKGIYKIVEWAHIINAHPLVGPGIIEGLYEASKGKERALLLLAQMSSKDNLITDTYTKEAVEFSKKYPNFVIGFISMEKITDDPSLLHLTPGIQMSKKSDSLGQKYKTPETAMVEDQTDIIIVGRGVYQDDSPAEKAKEYQEIAWQAYQKRV